MSLQVAHEHNEVKVFFQFAQIIYTMQVFGLRTGIFEIYLFICFCQHELRNTLGECLRQAGHLIEAVQQYVNHLFGDECILMEREVFVFNVTSNLRVMYPLLFILRYKASIAVAPTG